MIKKLIHPPLKRSKCALLIIDVQEKLFNHIERPQEILKNIQKIISGFQVLHIPIYISEQYPEGLGSTIIPIQLSLAGEYRPLIKTTFSCMDDPTIHHSFLSLPIEQWILVGIEAHICVLLTAKGLIQAEKSVIILSDAISSRSVYNYSTAIAEMRDGGARISCMETVLFELVKDSHAPEFKAISELIKAQCSCC